MLDQIAQEAQRALAAEGFDIPLFFILPTSGQSIVTFGTPGDPTDEQWEQAGRIVSAIVQKSVGLRGTRCREVVCATTHDRELHDAIA